MLLLWIERRGEEPRVEEEEQLHSLLTDVSEAGNNRAWGGIGGFVGRERKGEPKNDVEEGVEF